MKREGTEVCVCVGGGDGEWRGGGVSDRLEHSALMALLLVLRYSGGGACSL